MKNAPVVKKKNQRQSFKNTKAKKMAFVVGVSLVVAKNVKIARKVLLSGEGIIRIILGTIGQKENMAYQVTNITSLPKENPRRGER